MITRYGPIVPFTGGYRALLGRRRLAALLTELRPDRLEVSDRTTLRWTGQWAREHGVPAVMVSHESLTGLFSLPADVSGMSRWRSRLLSERATALADALNRRSSRNYQRIVCTTRWAAAEFERIGAPNLTRIPLGVDLELFSPERYSDAARETHAKPDQTLLVHCARLSVEKKPHRSLAALAGLRAAGLDAVLVVAGDGPLRARLERAARRASLPVRFAGFVTDPKELAILLASADVVIAPGPVETFGLAALEALACGTPVVVSASAVRCPRWSPPPGSRSPARISPAACAPSSPGTRSRGAPRHGPAPRSSAGRPRSPPSWRSTKPSTPTRFVLSGRCKHDADRDSRRLDHPGHGRPRPVGGWRGWARHLAAGLPDPELHNLAVLGAQAKHVERDQLPAALAAAAATSPASSWASTTRCGPASTRCGPARPPRGRSPRCTAGGATVLTMRLPDPAQMFGLPAGLARPLSRRMQAVNAELDKVAAHYGTLHWDASTRPGDLRPAQLVGGPAAPQRARAPADRLPALGPARRRRARGGRAARPRADRPRADPPRRLPVDGHQGHQVVPAPFGRPHPLPAVHGGSRGAGRAEGVGVRPRPPRQSCPSRLARLAPLASSAGWLPGIDADTPSRSPNSALPGQPAAPEMPRDACIVPIPAITL